MERADDGNHRLNYRAAIALNNIACSLMQRGNYADCVATLKDALNLMRDGAINTEAALRRAQMALSLQSSQIHCGGGGGHPIVHIVSSQTNPIQVGESLLLGKGDEGRTLYAICIDLAPVEDGDTPEVEAFTMLYNYGIAFSCMAMYCQEEDSFHSNAHRIFKTVEHWMSSRVQQDDSHSRILTVYLLLMRNLEEATAWLGSIQVASQYHQTLQQWVEYLRVQEKPLLALPLGAAAA